MTPSSRFVFGIPIGNSPIVQSNCFIRRRGDSWISSANAIHFFHLLQEKGKTIIIRNGLPELLGQITFHHAAITRVATLLMRDDICVKDDFILEMTILLLDRFGTS